MIQDTLIAPTRTASARPLPEVDGRVGSLGVWRHSRWDAVLVGLAVAHGVLLVQFPTWWVVALGLWWNSNTISHNFLHSPFFRNRTLNRFFGLYLTVLLGVPQTLWRDRHLAHHADVTSRWRWSRALGVEVVLVLALWTVLLVMVPHLFLTAYLPGYLLGLGICQLHGYYEHHRGTISHYGWLYNFLFFNDGFHVEHHAHPGQHWRCLPGSRDQDTVGEGSRWPAVFRWMELFSLNTLEQLVLVSPRLQRFVLARHERALRRHLDRLPEIRTVAVVGGGLFPRTPMVLQRLLPQARIRVIEASQDHIEMAHRFLPGSVIFEHRFWRPEESLEADLVVVPLALVGDRRRVYDSDRSAALLVHDWIWRPVGQTVVVSWLLLKRLNLVLPCAKQGGAS